ncbi:ATP-binding protein [Burkholderia gladioli]
MTERTKIFKPCRRFDVSHDRRTGGHGLGLALARRVARVHGSGVRLEDSSLGGARFVITLPPAQGDRESKACGTYAKGKLQIRCRERNTVPKKRRRLVLWYRASS